MQRPRPSMGGALGADHAAARVADLHPDCDWPACRQRQRPRGERASGNGGRGGRLCYASNHGKSDRNSAASAGRLSVSAIGDETTQVRERSCMRSETSTLLETEQSLALGVRVRMSAFGLARHPKYGDRQGLIVGRGSASRWRVKFDERKSIQTIHQDYLETVERSGAVSSGQSDAQELSSTPQAEHSRPTL
jgi:hypothetical protein